MELQELVLLDQVHQCQLNKMVKDIEKENKELRKELKEAEAVEKKAEKEIVEKEEIKVETGKENVVQAEKKIAKEITKEEKKVDDVKEKLEEKKEEEKKEKTEVKEEKKAEVKEEKKDEAKKETKKDESFVKKTEAIVNGRNLNVSKKHAVAVCNFIKGKDVDVAINLLTEVEKLKKPVPMRGEIPHRKGIMSGRYPIKTASIFIRLLRSLKSNAISNELELEKCRLTCKTDPATRPYRRHGRGKMKRAHVVFKLVPITKTEGKQKV